MAQRHRAFRVSRPDKETLRQELLATQRALAARLAVKGDKP